MSFETERFITEIQNRPCIWNVLMEEYSNKVLKQRAWNEIAGILNSDWQNLEEGTKRKRIQELQKKWKGLRDYHAREKNKESLFKNGRPPKKRKTPFLDMLQFLNVSRAISQTSGNIHTETSSNINIELNKNSVRRYPNSGGKHSTQKQKKLSVFQEALLHSMDKQRENDPDMNFLLNILPEMKTMTPPQNFEFRFEIMKLIKHIKYNDALMQTGFSNIYPYNYNYNMNVQNNPSTSNNFNSVGTNSIQSPQNSPTRSTSSSEEIEDIKSILPSNSDNEDKK